MDERDRDRLYDRDRDREAERGGDVARRALPLGEHPVLEFKADFGTVEVEPVGPGQAPEVELRGRGADRVGLEVRAEGGVTRVTVGGSLGDWFGERGAAWDVPFWGKRGHVRTILRVPAAVRGRIHTNAGKIVVERLAGCDLEVITEAGAVDLVTVAGRLRVHTNAGRVDGRDLRGTLDVETNAGAVRLDIAALDPGVHRVATDIGSVRIELPRGLAARVRAHTQLGSSRVDFPSVEGAPAVLEVSAQVGSVKVRTSSRTADPPRAAAPPYRALPVIDVAPEGTAATPGDDVLMSVLERVARGELGPEAARALLRELGHG